MPSIRQIFLSNIAKTNEMPLMLEVERAEGMYIYNTNGKKYMDMNSGISVSSLGHCHPNVVNAVKKQVDKHMHTMVYGEHIQSPQVKYASLLTSLLNENLEQVYFVMTGTETIELAMKLSRKHTGRSEIISCSGAYHGSTYGAEALRSDYDFTRNFAPGVPGIRHIHFNKADQLKYITEKTACVIMEAVQAESGVIIPQNEYLKKMSARCKETGTLFILDEIQTGFGRTGHLFAHQKYGVSPDVLLIAKSMGGGMPIGAIVSSKEIFASIMKNPNLGHITTFGGHPVSCAAAFATLETLISTAHIDQVLEKEALIRKHLVHPIIKEIRSSGLMMAVELTKRKYLKHVVAKCFEEGLLIDWFLFNNRSFRLCPPLIISKDQILEACEIFNKSMDYAFSKYNTK
jgi:acetylornithine/succinyldiaminopimelate/putrescine aminotransferase